MEPVDVTDPARPWEGASPATRLPEARGPVSAFLFDRLTRPPHDLDPVALPAATGSVEDEDLQIALFACYELHYQGFGEVDERWEWHPSLLRLRDALERRFERDLARAVPRPAPVPPAELPHALGALAAAGGPPLADFLHHRANPGQFREFVVHRSIYHLKEADPHTWGIPRLSGPAKAALVEIQSEEYGCGRAERMHAELFRATMRGLGLDDAYGAHLDRVPAVTLAVNNVMSLFGLHRRLRGALLGHLAALEMTSSLPSAKYGRGLRRLGGDATTTRFYDEHVHADAVHQRIAGHDMCGAFAAAHPELTGDVLYGAACCLALDGLFSRHVMTCWENGTTSLR
ncbi:iron-containing redox enzyme family protein [Sphaerisporangium corydalis]|uniref:Iron-containing redox enzyme family protein n=1 Tax=Sphaerisporangium corydalis TaxID=1441875 RepID=A0ABV9E9L4_9ACTN|nr:iron-containing redox enzyme family protein [Sphaerisporangium corydalis]